jgi:hypothetical protein
MQARSSRCLDSRPPDYANPSPQPIHPYIPRSEQAELQPCAWDLPRRWFGLSRCGSFISGSPWSNHKCIVYLYRQVVTDSMKDKGIYAV